MAGFGLAVAASSAGGMGSIWGKLSNSSVPRKNSSESSFAFSETDLDRRRPQEQAELLLQRAVDHSDGATDQIEARVDGWRGKLQWNNQFGQLTTAALNSSDAGVRNFAIEVELHAYGLTKSQPTVEALVKQVGSTDHTKKIWAFWGWGCWRTVVSQWIAWWKYLAAHLKELTAPIVRKKDSRRWAVEGLHWWESRRRRSPAHAMRNDPSALVREWALAAWRAAGRIEP